jgi:hypothetical protein
LLALTTPPEGETVEPAVHDAALALSFSLISEAPDVPERTALLLFECENVEG